MTIKIIAVDDHPLILKALETLFAEYQDLELVGTANKGSQLIPLVREVKPDIVILDLGMRAEVFDPIAAVQTLHEHFPKVKVLILTGDDDGLWVRELLKAGACGYILKSDDFSLNIPLAIRSIYDGGKFISPAINEKLMEPESVDYTPREVSILNQLSQGLSTEVIAKNLGVSEQRIRNLLVALNNKLGVKRGSDVNARVTAVNKARKLGLIHDNPDCEIPGDTKKV